MRLIFEIIQRIIAKFSTLDSENHTWTGENAFSKNISAITAPSAGAHLTNKNYVDAKIAKATSWQGGLDVTGSTTTLPILKDVFVGFQWRISAGEIVVGETKYGVGDLIVADVEMIGIDPKPVSSFSFFNGQDEDVVLLNEVQSLTNKDLSDETNAYRLASSGVAGAVKIPSTINGTGDHDCPTATMVRDYVSGGYAKKNGDETGDFSVNALNAKSVAYSDQAFEVKKDSNTGFSTRYSRNEIRSTIWNEEGLGTSTVFKLVASENDPERIIRQSEFVNETKSLDDKIKTVDGKFTNYALKNGNRSIGIEVDEPNDNGGLEISGSDTDHVLNVKNDSIRSFSGGLETARFSIGSVSSLTVDGGEFLFNARDSSSEYAVLRRKDAAGLMTLGHNHVSGWWSVAGIDNQVFLGYDEETHVFYVGGFHFQIGHPATFGGELNFTGNSPTAPTPPTTDNSKNLATTAFVKANIAPVSEELSALKAQLATLKSKISTMQVV